MAGRGRLNRERTAARRRQEILRQATLYTVLFFLAAVFVAAAGAALIALLLRFSGLPFLRSWLVIFAVVLAVVGGGMLIRRVRERGRTDD